MIDMKLAKQRYNEHKKSAKRRNDILGNPIEFRLTFEQWWDIWYQSGKWHQRGNKKGEYCMSRYNDIGHYEVGNVRIVLNSENIKEAQKGRPRSEEAKAKQGATNKGRHFGPATKTQCPYCGLWAAPNNMKRWHGDNCKKAPV